MDVARWNAMFATAEKIQAVAPWRFLAEDVLFAVQPRVGGPVFFASVMGMAGIHRAVAFYKGGEGLDGFRRANDPMALPRISMESLLLCEQLQLSYEKRKHVLPTDMEALKACGKRYRGNWPVFHSHRPGRIPWTIQEADAPELLILLERSLAVFERIARGEDLVRPLEEEEFFLVDPEGNDAVCRVDDLPESRHILQFGLGKNALDHLPRTDQEVEVEMALMLSPVQHPEPGEAPYLPFLVVMLDVDSGLAMGFDMLNPSESVDSALIRLPETLTNILEKAGVVPGAMRVRHPSLLPLMHAYCQTYGIELIEVEEFEFADLLIEQLKATMV